MSTYSEARAEAEERWLEDRMASWQAHEADFDREYDGQHYHYPENGTGPR